MGTFSRADRESPYCSTVRRSFTRSCSCHRPPAPGRFALFSSTSVAPNWAQKRRYSWDGWLNCPNPARMVGLLAPLVAADYMVAIGAGAIALADSHAASAYTTQHAGPGGKEMAEPLTILNLGGHPKDAILYAGGTMAKHAARGDHVCILVPTTGLSHHLAAIDDYRDSGDMPDMSGLVGGPAAVSWWTRPPSWASRMCGSWGTTTTYCFPREDVINDIADVIGELPSQRDRHPLAVRHGARSRGDDADASAGHRPGVGDPPRQALRADRRETRAERRPRSSTIRTWAAPTCWRT